jgi:hypothetical protein
MTARAPQLVPPRRHLSPALKDWLDRAVIPNLVDAFIARMRREGRLASRRRTGAQCAQPEPEEVQP